MNTAFASSCSPRIQILLLLRFVCCWQILLALDYMHTRNVLHRDLKTQNIFIQSGACCALFRLLRLPVCAGSFRPALPLPCHFALLRFAVVALCCALLSGVV
jgi:serine/threonine protein kinase